MGEIADDLIDRMMEDGYFPGRAFMPNGSNRKHKAHKSKGKTYDEATRAAEFPSKKTDPSLLPNYPEKTFDMGFFPTMPVKKTPNSWEQAQEEDPPF